MPVTVPNKLSLLAGTETLPLAVMVYSLLLLPLMIPFTASIQEAVLFTTQFSATGFWATVGTVLNIASQIPPPVQGPDSKLKVFLDKRASYLPNPSHLVSVTR
jgi:hypothetical protein